ncbi:PLP-dependent transferase [Exidia glandulosa HHB12029]|uniref:PLP-dependent transferase n=1 Tax=Exidia glandulosa HHB12029 TaxID=1314781 RepID=A0A165M3X1_EXIGL|nr:PLP-dependent transferase [Exidia glandulosa HHB12029]
MFSSCTLAHQLATALQSRQERGILRRLDPARASGVDFASNDYLSLTRNAQLRDAFVSRLANSEAPVLGSGGSRLLVPAPAHAALESRLARVFHAPAALLFNSGFDANVAFFQCVPQRGDVVLYDALIHASVHDGLRVGRATAAPFAHNDVRDLERRLRGVPEGANVFVAVESLYSMDGDFAPLQLIVDALRPLGDRVHLIVDEAHATGVYGRGLVAQAGLEDRVFARLITFGKALGATGAALLVPALLREYLLNYARPLIYTTALANYCVVAIDCSLDLLENGQLDALAARLHRNIQHFVNALRPHIALIPRQILALPAPDAQAPSPILPLLTYQPHALAAHLRKRGLVARPIAAPTVPRGQERVRVCVQAGHTEMQLDALAGAVVEWANTQSRARL